MKYIVAVSGGVDSVVLLDMLVRQHGRDVVAMAHFEHGIRGESSQADARFAEGLAAQYGIVCEVGYGNLGADTSEEEARTKRYEFLKAVASKYSARLVTAHHQGDLIETIAINLTRGTGWRGLAVFGDTMIERPLISLRKSEIYAYAVSHNLEWVEDETNQQDVYLRNRLRRKLCALSGVDRKSLLALYDQQVQLKGNIDDIPARLPLTSRYFMIMIDELVALELLRALLARKALALTRPQRRRLLLAIKTAKPGDVFQAGGGVTVRFNLREFIVN